MPKMGFARKETKAVKASVPISGSTPSVISFRPMNSTPKPMQMSPMVLEFLLLTNMARTMPATSAMGASLSVLNSHRSRLPSDWMEPSRII